MSNISLVFFPNASRQSTKNVSLFPFSCAPNAIRTSTWNPFPEMLAGKAKMKMTNRPHFIHIQGGYPHVRASTMSLSTAGLATMLSHICDIPPLLKHDQIMRDNRLKHDQILRDNRLPVQCRRVASRRHGTVIAVTTHMSLPPV